MLFLILEMKFFKFSNLFLLLFPIQAFNQPIVTNAEKFSVGMVLKLQKCEHEDVHPGSPGPGQVWDFSTLKKTQEILTEWMIHPSEAPKAELFPTANLVEKYSDGRYVYVKKNSKRKPSGRFLR